MDDRDKLLIRVLAATDVLWMPNRGHLQIVSERRRLFAHAGIPWSGQYMGVGDDAASAEALRMSVSRHLAAIAADKFLACSNPTGMRTTAVRLTDMGDDYTRALIGGSMLTPGALAVMREIHALR